MKSMDANNWLCPKGWLAMYIVTWMNHVYLYSDRQVWTHREGATLKPNAYYIFG